jgi:hypothetical protein
VRQLSAVSYQQSAISYQQSAKPAKAVSEASGGIGLNSIWICVAQALLAVLNEI